MDNIPHREHEADPPETYSFPVRGEMSRNSTHSPSQT